MPNNRRALVGAEENENGHRGGRDDGRNAGPEGESGRVGGPLPAVGYHPAVRPRPVRVPGHSRSPGRPGAPSRDISSVHSEGSSKIPNPAGMIGVGHRRERFGRVNRQDDEMRALLFSHCRVRRLELVEGLDP